MKKRSFKDMNVHISGDPAEIFRIMRESSVFPADGLPYPFTEEMLLILRSGNPLPQRYYYIENGSKYAFFTVYDNRMDLFTFGRARLMLNIQTIAFPCSLSTGGYVTNDIEMMLRYIKTIKGCKLVLNIPEHIRVRGMSSGETLPTCRLNIPDGISSVADFLSNMRSQYRRRINLALKECSDVHIIQTSSGDIDVHPLYLQTYERSDYKLERLEKVFFDKADGDRLIFIRNGRPAGFVLLKINGSELLFLLCGMDYQYDTADLYYLMLLKIVEYAIGHGCRTIDLGQTSEKTKLRFGAVLEKRYFCAHHTNPLLNLFAIAGKHLLEYKYCFPKYKVFKDEL